MELSYTMVLSHKIEFKAKSITKTKEGHFVMTKSTNHQQNILLDFYLL